MNKWHKWDGSKGYRQKRPPLYKWVVVQLEAKSSEKVDFGVQLKPGLGLIASYPPGIAVGYRKDAAGDKSYPYFVIPGIGGKVLAWCDCLPLEFKPPAKEIEAPSDPNGRKSDGSSSSPKE
jgi:hypothetical protein